MSSKFASFVSQVPSNGEAPSLSTRTSFTNETHMKEATPLDTQPFVERATTTTIFMNRDGLGMKAPVVVNSHRLRLSPDAERCTLQCEHPNRNPTRTFETPPPPSESPDSMAESILNHALHTLSIESLARLHHRRIPTLSTRSLMLKMWAAAKQVQTNLMSHDAASDLCHHRHKINTSNILYMHVCSSKNARLLACTPTPRPSPPTIPPPPFYSEFIYELDASFDPEG